MKNNSSGYSLWKASSGQKYSHLDNYCSLKSIGSVIGTDNVSDVFYTFKHIIHFLHIVIINNIVISRFCLLEGK